MKHPIQTIRENLINPKNPRSKNFRQETNHQPSEHPKIRASLPKSSPQKRFLQIQIILRYLPVQGPFRNTQFFRRLFPFSFMLFQCFNDQFLLPVLQT